MNQQLIEKIYSSTSQWCLAVTGGGTSAIANLFSVAGASSTILEALVPYHADTLKSFLGARSEHGCDTYTARAMAMQAYLRARSINTGQAAYGLGCTAAIATNRQRKGADRCHIAIQSATTTFIIELTFDKNLSRDAQEAYCADAIIQSMAQILEITGDSALGSDADVQCTKQLLVADEVSQALLQGEVKKTSDHAYEAVFPGTFNPMHNGHKQMLALAQRQVGGDIALEISIRNVDKPPLDFLTMAERQQHVQPLPLVYTNAPTFVEKSALFPGALFIVGLDTVIRIADPGYYESENARDEAINTMAERGNMFLVFGRYLDGDFQTLNSIEILPALKALCISVDESEFRVDISSTTLRNNRPGE